jgi:hypothetical protein
MAVALRPTLLPWTVVMYAQYPREAQQTALGGLICLLFILCALGTFPAAAQNVVGQYLLELDDDQRNAAFTLMLKDSDDRRCDQVIRTLFNGTVVGVDDWEALCKNRTAYSISVLGEPDETIVTWLTCRELWAASNMLLHRSGSRSKAAHCRIK